MGAEYMGDTVKANADVMATVGIITDGQRWAIHREVDRHIAQERQEFTEFIRATQAEYRSLPWWKRLFKSSRV